MIDFILTGPADQLDEGKKRTIYQFASKRTVPKLLRRSNIPCVQSRILESVGFLQQLFQFADQRHARVCPGTLVGEGLLGYFRH